MLRLLIQLRRTEWEVVVVVCLLRVVVGADLVHPQPDSFPHRVLQQVCKINPRLCCTKSRRYAFLALLIEEHSGSQVGRHRERYTRSWLDSSSLHQVAIRQSPKQSIACPLGAGVRTRQNLRGFMWRRVKEPTLWLCSSAEAKSRYAASRRPKMIPEGPLLIALTPINPPSSLSSLTGCSCRCKPISSSPPLSGTYSADSYSADPSSLQYRPEASKQELWQCCKLDLTISPQAYTEASPQLEADCLLLASAKSCLQSLLSF